MPDKKDEFYKKLRKKISNWINSKAGQDHKYSDYLLLAPDLFHLLCKLAVDPRIPSSEKAKLAGAITYFISPIDLIPEAILGPGGFIDDIALAAYVLNSIITKTDPLIVKEHWAGDANILIVIKNILNKADEMLGSGMWRKLKMMIKGK